MEEICDQGHSIGILVKGDNDEGGYGLLLFLVEVGRDRCERYPPR